MHAYVSYVHQTYSVLHYEQINLNISRFVYFLVKHPSLQSVGSLRFDAHLRHQHLCMDSNFGIGIIEGDHFILPKTSGIIWWRRFTWLDPFAYIETCRHCFGNSLRFENALTINFSFVILWKFNCFLVTFHRTASGMGADWFACAWRIEW